MKKMMTSTRMGKDQKHYKPIQEFTTNNLALDRKIKEACIGLRPCTQHLLMELPTDEDRELIADYIIEWANTYGNGIMMSVNTKIGYITSLVYLSRYVGHKKSFKQMTREDIIDGYLKSIKRDFSQDPDQKWVNTYKTRANKILAFWKWMTQPSKLFQFWNILSTDLNIFQEKLFHSCPIARLPLADIGGSILYCY
jgi:hypothetical protein